MSVRGPAILALAFALSACDATVEAGKQQRAEEREEWRIAASQREDWLHNADAGQLRRFADCMSSIDVSYRKTALGRCIDFVREGDESRSYRTKASPGSLTTASPGV